MFYFFKIYLICEQRIIEIIQFNVKDNNKKYNESLLMIYFLLYI